MPGPAGGLITHGEVIEALVANRLTAPAPMVRVQEWAAAMAVDEAYGITPELLNDDRITRALDAVAPYLDEITGSAGQRRSLSSGWMCRGCTGI